KANHDTAPMVMTPSVDSSSPTHGTPGTATTLALSDSDSGNALATGSTEWPVWSILLAALVVLAAVLCAVRCIRQVIHAAIRSVLKNRSPLPVSLPHRRRWIAITMVIAASASFLITRWVQAGNGPPPTLPPTRPCAVNASVPPAITTTRRTTPAEFTQQIVPALQHHGLSHSAAVLFAAHLARETGWGRAVQQHNYGNIKTGSWSGPSFWLTDARGFRDKYRAYGSIRDGLSDAIDLIRKSSRYRRAWRLLERGDTRWYGQLGLDGYYETTSPQPGRHGVHDLATIANVQREYDQIVNLVRHHAAAGGI